MCIGVGEYKHLGALNNAVRDAEQVNAKLNDVPSCRSDIVKDPKTKIELVRKIRTLLEEPRLQEKPPELFCLYYAGHAFEHGAKVYLVPTDAKLERMVDDCEIECLSLDNLMQLLRDKLDLPVRDNKGKERAIVFVIILDSCRNAVADRSIGRDLACEVAPGSAPHKYTVFFSCSRTTTASDGPSGGHSPFARALLDAEGGFFAEGVTLRDTIYNVSRAVEKGTQQSPIEVRLAAIPQDFCICPKAVAQPDAVTVSARVLPEDVSEGAGSADTVTSQYEIVAYLKRQGLGRIAERVCEELGLEEIDDLRYIKTEGLNKLEWLEDVQKAKLLKLLKLCHQVSPRSNNCTAALLFRGTAAGWVGLRLAAMCIGVGAFFSRVGASFLLVWKPFFAVTGGDVHWYRSLFFSRTRPRHPDVEDASAETQVPRAASALQESKKQDFKTLVDKLGWKIRYEDQPQGGGFRARVVLTKLEGDTVELEWSETNQNKKDSQQAAAEIGLAYCEEQPMALLLVGDIRDCQVKLKTLVDKLRWKIKYAEDEDRSKPLSERFRLRVVLEKAEGDTVELEWSEAKQNKKDAQKAAAEISLAYFQKQPITLLLH
jgi:hypothetical protein